MDEDFEKFKNSLSSGNIDSSESEDLKCPHCEILIPDSYLEQNPFPEFPCPSCNAVLDRAHLHDSHSRESNRRTEPRCPVALKVAYKSFDVFYTDFTRNVSKGGMFIRSKGNHKKGGIIELLLHVPDFHEPLKISAEIVHTHEDSEDSDNRGIGVKFLEMNESSRQILIDFLTNSGNCG